MINFNGSLVPSDTILLQNNRAFLFADGVFETMKIVDGQILFFEDHYFRLMASMRVVRMEIPMHFNMEYLQAQVLDVVAANNLTASARARITVYRNEGGFYLPKDNTVSFLISVVGIENPMYEAHSKPYEVELYKDFFVSRQLLSSIKTTNRILNVTGSIFASENGYDNCLLLNDAKNVIEALQGNLFMLAGNKLITPPISEGCLNGVMRKQIITLAQKMDDLEIVEEPISPFDLQKADELFITNVIIGVQPVTKYRKKEFVTQLSEKLVVQLNRQIRMG